MYRSGGVTDVTGVTGLLTTSRALVIPSEARDLGFACDATKPEREYARILQLPKLLVPSSQKLEAGSHCINSAGLPVSRSIRFAIGGCVENKLPKFIPNSGWIINRCAVDGDAAIGTRREYASSFCSALASA
jgi:hypothetical protein